MEIVWKDIAGFEGLYQVSNYGEVKALERLVMNNGSLQRKHERILKPNKTRDHLSVVLCKNGKTYTKLVHRLVAFAFIENHDNKPVVDHIDTNPRNNCVENLRWVTTQENCMNPITRKKNSESKKGHPYHGRPLTKEERQKISDALRGKKLSVEHRQKISDARKNSSIALESSRRNIMKAHKGNHWKIVDGKRTWY